MRRFLASSIVGVLLTAGLVAGTQSPALASEDATVRNQTNHYVKLAQNWLDGTAGRVDDTCNDRLLQYSCGYNDGKNDYYQLGYHETFTGPWDAFLVDHRCKYWWGLWEWVWVSPGGYEYKLNLMNPIDRLNADNGEWIRFRDGDDIEIYHIYCSNDGPYEPPPPPPDDPPLPDEPQPGNPPSTPRNHADLNGDNKADVLAIYDGTGGLHWYPGKGDGTFWSARYISQAGFKLMAKGDLDGDGKADLLAIYDGTGGMYWYPGKGDGTFWAARYISQAGFRHMELADLNGDGKLDLLAIYDGTGGMYWYPGKGDGTFWSARYIDQAGFKNMAL